MTALDALIDDARRSNTSALVILNGGAALVDEVMDGVGDRPIETMSVTKAVVSLLVGRAVTLGHLPGVDLRIGELYPEWRQGRKRDVTLRHLMTHTSGLQNVPMAPAEIYPSPDLVQLALCAEPEHVPGTRFAYNNKAVNLICGVLERTTGRRADEFARTELFGPLGITDWRWQRDPAGTPHGMSGLRVHARDLARLGQLALRRGGELISPEWIDMSTRPASDVYPGIGLLWWLLPAWTRYEVTDAHAEAIRTAGAAPAAVAALHAARGTWISWPALWTALAAAGFERNHLPPGVPWLSETTGPQAGYRHDGWLGQHLVVVPDAELVAVRLIGAEHPAANAGHSGWPDFPDRVLELAAEYCVP